MRVMLLMGVFCAAAFAGKKWVRRKAALPAQ
jgi:hypothetical protein